VTKPLKWTIDNILTCYYATGDAKYLKTVGDISKKLSVPMQVRVYADTAARLATLEY
jgi:hypothetical protein